jgi:hypothetical protein
MSTVPPPDWQERELPLASRMQTDQAADLFLL